MNLTATIKLYGGGPGSGCRGENCGRPSTGEKPQQTLHQFYHGTVLPSAKKILVEGIKDTPTQAFNLTRADMHDHGYVFLTDDKNMAQRFAEFRQKWADAPLGTNVESTPPKAFSNRGAMNIEKTPYNNNPNMIPGKAAVVELSLPEDEIKSLQDDPAMGYGIKGAWRKQGIIPPKYITGVEVLNGNRWKKLSVDEAKVAAQAMKTVYLVYYGPLDALKMHLKAGNENSKSTDND